MCVPGRSERMYRTIILICLVLGVGCSGRPTDTDTDQAPAEVEEGGHVENAHRETAEEFFVALRKVRSAEEEKKILSEFGQWLSENRYSISVEENRGTHRLSCPHFPPVTPWTDYEFIDIENLELLPQTDVRQD